MSQWNTSDNKASDALRRVRGVAWASLQPAIDHAIVLAEEAEADADKATFVTLTQVYPTYPPLVEKLALAQPKPAQPVKTAPMNEDYPERLVRIPDGSVWAASRDGNYFYGPDFGFGQRFVLHDTEVWEVIRVMMPGRDHGFEARKVQTYMAGTGRG